MHPRKYCTLAIWLVLLALSKADDDITSADGTKLSLRNCRQSSDYAGQARCTGAIDGNTDQRFSMTTMSTTGYDATPWWETQVERETEFTKVRIYNRQDCCPERLNNFVIKVDGQVCAEYNSATAFSVKTFTCRKKGRVLRIESRIQTHLTMAEVQVYGFEPTPATAGTQLHLSNCRQSSDYLGRSRCTGAIDGTTKQSWSFEGVSTTSIDPRPWWEAQTDSLANILQVRIFNRQDCCPERLNNFVIKVDDVVCADYNSNAAFSVWTFDCKRLGKVVRIESRVSTYLTLAEVQVFGELTEQQRTPVQLQVKNCRQSSDYAGQSRCTGAIDGNTDQRFSMTTMSTTNNDANPWWEAQMEHTTEFTSVRIFNRQDCCPERLNNFVIKVDGNVCAEYNSATAFSVDTFKCNREGRVIRIESRVQTHLSLAEVQIFGYPRPTKHPLTQLRLTDCSQSSNYGTSRCTGAIDGKIAQTFSMEGMSTTNADALPWWEAKTEAPSKIKRVRIYNRQDCCPERLGNFVIKVDDEVCAEYTSGAPFSIWTFDCNRVGRVVRIQSKISTYLTLAEVQVFGHAEVKEEPEPEPVLLTLKNCRQSSDYLGQSRCTGAIDGNTNQQFSMTTMSTTNNDPIPWWEAQTEQLTEFYKVRIYNRQDCCPDRLNNFVIKVDGEVCAEYNSPTPFAIETFKCRRAGRVIRIESRKQTHLTLAEVQVFGMAVGPKSATPQLSLSSCSQSSNYGTSRCTGAIDGNIAQTFSMEGMSTTNADAVPWWEAKTDAASKILQVKIYNRQDCCPERLGNFVIKVDGEVCAEYTSGTPFSIWTFDCNRIGTVVRIESKISTHLTLAEVQVFGEPAVKECFRQQEVFVGTRNVTLSGKPCQSWAIKSCPEEQKGVSCHVPSSLIVDASYTGNTCRNPSENMKDKPWCYTTTPTRWEYCNVVEC